MNMDIEKKYKVFLKKHPAVRQWMWFVLLWSSGLIAAVVLAYPIKLLIKLAS